MKKTILLILVLYIASCGKDQSTTKAIQQAAKKLPEKSLTTQSIYPTQRMSIAWDKSLDPNVVGYKVYLGSVPDPYDHPASVTDVGNVTSFTIFSIIAGQPYFVQVTDYSAQGYESVPSLPLLYSVPMISAFPGNGSMTISFVQPPNTQNLTYYLEQTTNLSGGWTTTLSFTPTFTMLSNGFIQVTGVVPYSIAPNLFFMVKGVITNARKERR